MYDARFSGVLLAVSSLPGPYGIGSLGAPARRFVDFLAEAGQTYWQILPLVPPGHGNSPYMSPSAFAGNSFLIDLDELAAEGLLTQQELDSARRDAPDRVDYAFLHETRMDLLEQAFRRSLTLMETAPEEHHLPWIGEYAQFAALHDQYEGSPDQWPEDAKPDPDRVAFHTFLQDTFYRQWFHLKEYANQKHIRIMGDVPFYLSADSAEVYYHPELFQLDEHGRPSAVAGCPPDGFSATGQLWGNPLYRWDYHAQTGYVWWISRLRHCFTLYDVVRVDHFRGFDEYYAIPYGDKTAENGVWKKGPGIDLFHTVKKELGDVNIIAEDLGYLTESVMKLVEDTGYPGMKVLQFAFDSREESNYLPHNYPHNCVVYTGTHDNNTVRGWLDDMCEEDNALAEDYMNNADTPKDERPWEFIRLALGSVADLAVIPLQDYLCLGTEARINLPSTLGNNWKWRLVPGQVTDEMLEKMCHLNKLFGRL